MSSEGEETGETQPPTSAPETVPTPASAAVPQPPQRSEYGHGHHPIEFRFLDELKRRNVGRVAILYLVVCWLILEPVHVIFHMLEVPVWANRLVIILMALGFPAVTIFAWVYEITPEGLKPTAEIPHGQSIRRQTGRRIDRAIIVVLVLALTYFVVDKFWISKHAPSVEGEKALNAPVQAPLPAVISDKSIAVLPFADMSEKKDQEYFADGLADEVSSLLATLPGLKVISRMSSFQFKGKNADVRVAASQLGAAFIVEGSVKRSGDRVRVSAQLISAQDGARHWSDTYERDFGDVLRLQKDIAASLGRALQVEVGGLAEQGAVTHPDAYTAYLRGLHAMDRFDEAGLEEAVGQFEQASVLDPSYLHPREGLARARYYQYALGFVAPTVGAENLRRAIDEVLRVDPHSAIGHALRAEVLITYDWDWTAAEKETRMALAAAKNNEVALYAAGDLASVFANWDDAERMLRQALAADPLNPDTRNLLSWTLYRHGHFKEAIAEGRRVLEIRPSYTTGHYDLALYLLASGDRAATLSEMQHELSYTARPVGLALALSALGRNAEAEAALRTAERESGNEYAYWIACLHAFRGEIDAAFHWLDRAYAQKDYLLEYIKGEPTLKSLVGDRRYKAFLRKMNLPE